MRIAVLGTGLMGASVALAARERGDDVVGWDPEPETLAAAVVRTALDPAPRASRRPSTAPSSSIVAAPIAQLPAAVVSALAASGEATVTDVGSTKSSVVQAAAGSPRFVGGHPICGSETRGRRERERPPVRGGDVVPDAGHARPIPPGTASCTASSPTSARRPSRSTPRRTTGSSR